MKKLKQKFMSITPEVVDIPLISLSGATVKGMDNWAVEAMEESVSDINEHLGRAGASLRYVALQLTEIKKNVKAGNWKAFLESGVLACSPKYATDLVAAHTKWLANADVEDSVIAQLTPRSLAAMANASDSERQKVFNLIENAGSKDTITEAKVRAAMKGKRAVKKKAHMTFDERLEKQITANAELIDMNKKLREENMNLRKQLSSKLIDSNKWETIAKKR